MSPRISASARRRLALAAYNAGLGHVEDARRLATRRGYDPNRWFGHVERAMRLLARPGLFKTVRHGFCRGEQTVRYVRRIESMKSLYVEALVEGG